MGSTLSAPWAYLQKQGWPWIGIPASLEILRSWSVKLLKHRRIFNKAPHIGENMRNIQENIKRGNKRAILTWADPLCIVSAGRSRPRPTPWSQYPHKTAFPSCPRHPGWVWPPSCSEERVPTLLVNPSARHLIHTLPNILHCQPIKPKSTHLCRPGLTADSSVRRKTHSQPPYWLNTECFNNVRVIERN